MARFDHASALVRYNAPLYGTMLVSVVLGGALCGVPVFGVRLVGGLVIAGALWYAVASVAAFHWMFDRSPLLEGSWIQDCASSPVQRWIQVSVALEQTTLPLERVFPEAVGQLFDLFSSERMQEPAVRRARASSAIAPSLPVAPEAFPADDGSSDLTVVTLAAHELRRRSDREALFRELARVTRADGSIVVVEHLRDLPALLAFGPGVLHFYPRRTWLDLAARTGLSAVQEFPLSPFVRVFVWRRGGQLGAGVLGTSSTSQQHGRVPQRTSGPSPTTGCGSCSMNAWPTLCVTGSWRCSRRLSP